MSEANKQEKIRKVFLDNLPRWKKGEGNGKIGTINWKNSVGYKVNFIYDDTEGYLEIINYEKGGYLYVKYLDKPIIKIKCVNLNKCKLGKVLGKYTSDFKVEIGQVFKDDKRNITIINKEYRIRYKKDGSKCNDKWYKYTCNKCGWTEGWIVESDLLKGNNCSCCTNRIVVEGINDIPTTAPWMIPYFQGGYNEAKLYTRQSNKKVYFICPDCERIRDKSIEIHSLYRESSIRCICGDGISYPQKFIFRLLEQLNINFVTEKTFDWCKFKKYKNKNKIQIGKYDFYFEYNGKQFIIEADGEQHTRKNDKSVFNSLEEQNYIDYTKDKLASDNDIEVIRIDCYNSNLEFIKNNILNSKLNEIFNISKVDWNNCRDFALSNRIKETCNLWNNGIKDKEEISKIMKLSYGTVNKYLKTGTEIGWCNYKNSKEISKKIYEENYLKALEMWNSKKYKMYEIQDSVKIDRKHIISYLKKAHEKGICDYTPELSNKIYLESKRIKAKQQDKKIICLENGVLFVSGYEVESLSKDMFGTKLYDSSVCQVCNGKQKHHKGYHFKYIQDLTQEERRKYNIEENIAS